MLRKINSKAILLIGTALLVNGCDKPEAPDQMPLRSVRYIEVSEAGKNRIRTFTGVSKSEQEAKLSFKVSGTLVSLDVAVGDSIESGKVIAVLDASGFELQLQQAQAELARSTAELRNADAAYKRARELYENENASKNDLDTARTAFESAKALVNASQRAVDLARLDVSYTKLIAKESCSVASTSADSGENISVGQEIVRVNCGEQLKVDVSVPDNLIASFKPGTPATIEFDSVPGEKYQGEVTEVGVAATGTTFPVSVRLIDSKGLRAGLAAQVGFRFASESSRLVVPVTAVSEDHNGRFIFLLRPGSSQEVGIIKRQAVEIGNIVKDGIEIVSGVNPGDRVVTAGVTVIRDGLEVRSN